MGDDDLYVAGKTQDPAPNARIGPGQKYRLFRLLAGTTFSFVWSGHAPRMGKLALKFVKRLKGHQDAIMRECSALTTLHHPSIVRLLDQFSVPGFHCLVFEHAAGGDLRAYAEDYSPTHILPESVVRCISGQILSALSYVHDLQLVHCDMKPENILVSRSDPIEPLILVADFGLVCSIDEAATCDKFVGTKQYAAPEVHQIDRKKGITGCLLLFLIRSHREG
jgi:serine/threonine protein kinase